VQYNRWKLAVVLVVVAGIAVLALGGQLAADSGSATMCEEALAEIESDGFTGDRFTFCVIGDTRVPGLAEIFPENLREMNLLDPAFIIDVGDLIPGYTDDVSAINRQWDDFARVCAASQVPLVPVVGNHDVWDWQSHAIYRQRIGPLAFSFSYGNAHFIFLDTEEPGRMNNIGPAQLRWLKEELEAHRSAPHIFVFMHKPIWQGVHSLNSNWLSEVHPLLAKYPVKAVFVGDEHHYRKWVVDGIPCFITGGGGAELDDDGFYHFMHVSVKGKQLSFAVVKTGGVVSEEIATGKTITTGK